MYKERLGCFEDAMWLVLIRWKTCLTGSAMAVCSNISKYIMRSGLSGCSGGSVHDESNGFLSYVGLAV